MGNILSRQQIIGNKRACKMVEIAVPHWGGNVMVKELTGSELDAFEAGMAKEYEKAMKGGKEYKPNVRALILLCCICDAEGKPIFEEGDQEALGNLPAWQIEALIDNADQLNRITAKYKESLEKKYAKAGGSASATVSRTDGESPTPEISLTSPAKSSKGGGRTGQ
jgi:hypothetical protein